MHQSIIQKIKNSPTEPGVYTFYQGNAVLYIGKAANLKNRLKSYLKITDLKTQSLHEEADHLEYTVLRSDIEALIEESRLIKSLKPKYNVLWMDDKTYSYVHFTKDTFPKIVVGHENLHRRSSLVVSRARIGPFTDGGALRIVLKLLRRSFPYCSCFQLHFRDCLNAQIGKCFGFCCKKDGVIANLPAGRQVMRIWKSNIANRKQYQKNIRAIKMVLNGTGKKLMASLKDEKERWALERIFEHKEFLNTYTVKPSELDIQKIECYDNSNFAGKEAVGAMTVLVKRDGVWMSDKNSYRKFKIKSAPTRDDPRMISEVLGRRLNHPEWPYPDLIVIDGGITQYRAAKRVLDEFHKRHTTDDIRLVSYAKPHRKVIGMAEAPKELQELIERAIHQTHNFVIRYHRQVRSKAMFATRTSLI
ncbi:MAG: GIY-YIG nuclease family protein [bacterium]|nr:GIY-YIG nuclease family protein [bacterium]